MSCARPGCSGSRSAWTPSTTSTFMEMNDVDFPVARVLDGIGGRRDAGLTPIKVNMVVKRGVNEDSILPMAEHFRSAAGSSCASSSTWTSARRNGWRLDEVVTAAEILASIDAVYPLEPIEPELPRRGGQPLSLPRRRGRDRFDRLGDPSLSAATAPAPACRPTGFLSLPVRRPGVRPAPSAAIGTSRTRSLADHLAALWPGRDDRYSEIRRQRHG